MEKETYGIVIKVAKQWWLKVNTKAVRMHALDGATFPHIIKVAYQVDGAEYTTRKWLSAGASVPAEQSRVKVVYDAEKPSKARIEI